MVRVFYWWYAYPKILICAMIRVLVWNIFFRFSETCLKLKVESLIDFRHITNTCKSQFVKAKFGKNFTFEALLSQHHRPPCFIMKNYIEYIYIDDISSQTALFFFRIFIFQRAFILNQIVVSILSVRWSRKNLCSFIQNVFLFSLFNLIIVYTLKQYLM